MSLITAVVMRVAVNGPANRILPPHAADIARHTRRWLGAELNALIDERAALYASDGMAHAWADVMTALWQVTGVAMTVDEYVRVWSELKGDHDER